MVHPANGRIRERVLVLTKRKTMKRCLLCLLAVFAAAGCTDETAARRALEYSGFSDVKITGYSYFGCDKHDTFSTGFEARNPKGQFVEGVVCSGWMKGATIRFE
jgi:hypothetical protein